MPGPNDACWCGSGKKYKRCHRDADLAEAPTSRGAIHPGRVGPGRAVPPGIAVPEYARTGRPAEGPVPLVLSADELPRMRHACHVAAQVLEEVLTQIRPGITTDDVDALTHEACLRRGAYPSPLNYRGFPKSVCTSINEVVCHGIPDSTTLLVGDVLKVDVTTFVDGMHGDTCATILVGGPDVADDDARRLVSVALDCRAAGIEVVRPGRPISDIGRAITTLARSRGCDVVQTYGGHGIGRRFHNSLHVPHHVDSAATTLMQPGMAFTVEPMINLGTWRVRQWSDGWTVVTGDGTRSAQFEHTLLVTATGAEILTVP
jgi:methionyl aminopeptidase